MLVFDAAPSSQSSLCERTVSVRAPGRLHLGFLDPGGSLGRSFGSLGLVIDGFATEVVLAAAAFDEVTAEAPEAQVELERARAIVQALRLRTGRLAPLSLRLRQVLPPHAGFGSGTQLALAIGRAFAHWHGLDVDTPTLAHWLGRGLRSGVGVAGFDHGGLLLDGGPGEDGWPGPLLSRLPFPPAWRIVVVQDTSRRGLSGRAEKQAIAALPPFPRASAAEICHQVLMRVLPGAASAQFAPFAAGIHRVQQLLGEHFAPAQGGVFTSAAVARLMRWIADSSDGGAALGQSSWGPTGFVIVASQAQAEALVAAAGQTDDAVSLRIVRACNHGAAVRAGGLP
ncbi:MAG: hypothetical protein FWG56_12980 [Desulfovibrionaceae bacterium]|jgi:beta-RFAP synthase|nr:hypothetical protein [Desulfovibrionaceae bacterium]